MAGRAEVVWDEVREELRQLLRDSVRDTVRELRELLHDVLRCNVRTAMDGMVGPCQAPEELRHSAAVEAAEDLLRLAAVSEGEASWRLPGAVPSPKASRSIQQRDWRPPRRAPSFGEANGVEGDSTASTSASGIDRKDWRSSSGSARRPHKSLDRASRASTPAPPEKHLPLPPLHGLKQLPLPSGGCQPGLPRLLSSSRGQDAAPAAPAAPAALSPGHSTDDLDSCLDMPSRLPSKGDSCAFRRRTFTEPAANIKSIWRSSTSKMERKVGGGTESDMLARVSGMNRRSLERLSKAGCFHLFRAWVSSPCFDYLMGVILVLNAVAVGAQVDYVARHRDHSVPRYFRAMDTLFCVVFSSELLLRIAASGCSFFTVKEGWKWNWFDTVIVAFAVIDELSLVLLEGTAVQEVVASLGVLRILRLGRIVRLVRMVRLIPELKSMVYLITASMSSFFWTVVLLLMLVYCFAVYFTEHATELSRQAVGEDQGLQVMLEYWGSVPRSTLALFMAISGGDDWRNFVDVFDDSTSSYLLNVVLFSTYIAFATMVMLNLVTGVFVDGAQKMFNQEQEDQLVRIAAKIFVDADKDSSESISFEEFARLVATRCLDDWFAALGFSLGEADKLFQIIDEDDSGSLNLSEFVRGCLRLKGNVKACDLALLKYSLKTQGIEIAKAIARTEELVRAVVTACTGASPDPRPLLRGSAGWYGASHMKEEILV